MKLIINNPKSPTFLDVSECKRAIDMPWSKGEPILRKHGWDGSEDVLQFVRKLRTQARNANRSTI